MNKRTKKFIEYCKKELDLDEQLNDYTYQSMALCVIDCVYSLRAQYDSTTKKVVRSYADKYMNGDTNSSQEQLQDLIRHIEEEGGTEAFAEKVLQNRQISGGVLKTEVCLKLAQYLFHLHINTMEDFRKFESPELLEIVIHSVKGMGDAGTNYLFMLAGNTDRCKPDTHVHHFVRDACGEDCGNDEIQNLFTDAVKALKPDYPKLTVSMLDGIVWRKYQVANRSR